MRVHPTGSVTVFTGSHSHGQGHETTFAQVVADAPRHRRSRTSTSCTATPAACSFGMGTYGSRSLAVGGTAIVKALDKIVAKGKKIAAHLLEAAEVGHRVQGRQVHRRGHRSQQDVRRDRAHRLRSAQLSARQARAGAERDRVLRSDQLHVSRGHAHLRGRDRSGHRRRRRSSTFTRVRRLRQHHQSDDRRRPGARRARAGHRPGAARELRLRPRERAAADRQHDGLRDAARGRPAVVQGRRPKVTPCTHNPLGAKGCGEAGAIGAPAAVMNAVLDALAAVGVKRPRHAGVAAARVAGDPAAQVGVANAHRKGDHHVRIRIPAAQERSPTPPRCWRKLERQARLPAGRAWSRR